MESEYYLPHSLSWARSIQAMPPSHFLKTHFNITSHLRLGLTSCVFPLGIPPKPCVLLSSLPYVPHIWPIWFFLTWSPKYLVRGTDHKAPLYVVFSTSLLPFLTSCQGISPSSRPCEMFHNMVIFYGEELLAPRPNPSCRTMFVDRPRLHT